MKGAFPAPTLRLFIVALALSIPLLLGILAPAFVGIGVAGLLTVLATTLVDYQTALRPKEIVVERRHEPRLYVAADNSINVVVTNRGRQSVDVRVRDTPPVAFNSSTLFVGGIVERGTSKSFLYTTRPTARGQYSFGDLTLRWRTPLGLLWRECRMPGTEQVAVYPNLLEIEKYDLLARRGLLREAGLRSARQLGRGTEFESLRDYQPDDDYRRINWHATARRHRPITAMYETERSQRLMIVLDLGRMMLTRVGELTRLDAAINAALLLGYVALARGDRVGLLGFADGVQVYLPPRRGKAHFYQIVESLYAIRARPVESSYATAFTQLRRDLHGRSLIAFFTDLDDPDVARSIARHLALLARQHLPLCIALNDPVLVARAKQLPDTGRQLYEKVIAALRVDEREVVLEELRQTGVLTVDAPADRLTLATINRYVELKERALL